MYIIVKGKSSNRFHPHYNRAMGKMIHTKKDYLNGMKQGGFIPFDEARKIAEQTSKAKHKPYDRLSPKAMAIVTTVSQQRPDKKGNIKLSGRTIEAMKEIGAIKPVSDHIPKEVKGQGGFE